MRKAAFVSVFLLAASSSAFAAPVDDPQVDSATSSPMFNVAASPTFSPTTHEPPATPPCALAPCLLPVSREGSLTGTIGQGSDKMGEWVESEERTEGDISYRPRGMLLMRWTLTF